MKTLFDLNFSLSLSNNKLWFSLRSCLTQVPHPISGPAPACPDATQPLSSPNEILWKVILYHPLTVH